MIFLADFPPPVHGMANVNLAVYNVLKDEVDVNVFKIDTSPPVPVKYFTTRLWVVAKLIVFPFLIVKLLFAFIFMQYRVVYRPINAGWGQFFDFVFLAISRLFKADIYIHHHCFNYLSSNRKLFSVLNYIAGKRCIHIVLGDEMKAELCERYGIHEINVRVLSNLAFFDETSKKKPNKNNKIVIGHLANLCEEKGLAIFIDVCRVLKEQGFKFNALLAGPFNSVEDQAIYEKNSDLVRYLGPLYGKEKTSFFESLDVFVFPSKYVNEAEPLVLYESAQFGCFLLGTRRGCMKSVIERLDGTSFNECHDLPLLIAEEIQRVNSSCFLSGEFVEMRRQLFNDQMVREKLVLTDVINEIKS